MPCVLLVRGGMALLLCALASVGGTFHITSDSYPLALCCACGKACG